MGWAGYDYKPCFEAFTKATGIKVNFTEQPDNDTIFAQAKLSLQTAAFDVVEPTVDRVKSYDENGLVQAWDTSKLGCGAGRGHQAQEEHRLLLEGRERRPGRLPHQWRGPWPDLGLDRLQHGQGRPLQVSGSEGRRVCLEPGLHAHEGSALMATTFSANPVGKGGVDKLDPAVAKFYKDAFPGDATSKLWWWPVQTASFLKLRADYADKFIAA